MRTINQQLNITPTPRNSNMRSRMARGANDYQVQLGTEDPSLDFYNDIQSISNYHNANGWSADSSSYSSFLGGYPPCVNLRCKNCKNECKTVKGLKWGDGGKECHKSCVLDDKNAQMDRISGITPTPPIPDDTTLTSDNTTGSNSPTGMSTGVKIGIGVGVLLLTIGIIVLVKRK